MKPASLHEEPWEEMPEEEKKKKTAEQAGQTEPSHEEARPTPTAEESAEQEDHASESDTSE